MSSTTRWSTGAAPTSSWWWSTPPTTTRTGPGWKPSGTAKCKIDTARPAARAFGYNADHPQPARPEGRRRHARGHCPAGPQEPARSCWRWASDAETAQAHHGAQAHRAVRRQGGRLRPDRLPHRLHRREDGLRAVRPSRAGGRLLERRAEGRRASSASSRSGWARATRCAPRPACRSTGTRWGSAPASAASATWAWPKAGFGSYVKPYKPWFIGREAYRGPRTDPQGRGGAASASPRRACAWPTTATRCWTSAAG